MDSDLGLVVTEMNNNNRSKRIKPDDLKANYRDKFVSSGDEGVVPRLREEEMAVLFGV